MLRFCVLLGLLLASLKGSAAGLDGLWVGYYSYDRDNRVPVSMVIHSDGSHFIGQMIEPPSSPDKTDIARPSMISGSIAGEAVAFDKAYFSDLESTDPMLLKNGASAVRYNLVISDNKRVMRGKWFIGDVSGFATLKRLSPEAVDRLH